MLAFLLFTTLCGSQLWANPFSGYLSPSIKESSHFYVQHPPFKYPFKQVDELNDLELDVNALGENLGHDKIDSLKSWYKSFTYNSHLNLYSYDFAIGSHWEFLPYPIVKDVQEIEPIQWIPEFSQTNMGLQTLAFLKSIDTLTNTSAYAGNKLEILKTPNSLKKIISKIEASKDHVFMSSFLFQCDAGSKEIMSVLEKKIKQGLEVFAIIDATFINADRSCVKRIKELGVHLALQGGVPKIFHEKMYVFDGEYAIVDGANLAGVQTLSNGSNNLINDMGIGVQGPMVQEVAHRFLYHWKDNLKNEIPEKLINFYAKKRDEAMSLKTESALTQGLEKKSGVCRLVTSNPGFKNRKILPMYLAYIKEAKEYLFFNQIDHRYQNILGNGAGKTVVDEIINTINRNPRLRVDMLSNQWKLPTDIALPDGMGTEANWFSFLITKPGHLVLKRPHLQITKARKNLIPLVSGKKFNWWASAVYMHAKTMMIDNIATMIGSYNISGTSEKLSYEQVMVCHDEELAKEMQKSILQDILNSIPIPTEAL